MSHDEANRLAQALQTTATGVADGTLTVSLRQALTLLKLVCPEFEFTLTEEKVIGETQVASRLSLAPVDRPTRSP